MKNRQLTALRCFLVGSLTLGLTNFGYLEKAIAQPSLQIYPLGWNVIGLDSNRVTDGPNQFVNGARVCNTGTTAATNVTATFVKEGGTSYISLVNNVSTLTIPSLPAGSTAVAPGNTSSTIPSNCYDFYFNTLIARDSIAYDTRQQFHINVTATGVSAIRTPINRELYVEKLVSQARNEVTKITGPTTVYAGDIVQYTVTGKTATQYEQLSFLPVLPVFFQLLGVSTTYSSPIGAINNSVYADACGWENNYTSSNYNSCIGPAGYSGGKVGNNVTTTYTIKVLGTGSGSLSNIIYDYSGSSYHYNNDLGTGLNSVTVTALSASADVATTITGPTTATAGSTVTYNITATNNGPSSASNVVVTDNIGKNLTNVVASNGGTYDATTGIVTFPAISSFAKSASQGYTVSFTAPLFGSVTNIVSSTSDTSDPTTANNNGTAANAKVVTIIPTDYGDAPDTGSGTGVGNYKTTASDGGASHGIVSNLSIGTAPDADDGTQQNATATADDLTGNDEGAIAFGSLLTTSTSYSVNNVNVINNTGKTAYLVGWIDFNRNGVFESGEAATVQVPSTVSGSQQVNLQWSGLSGLTSGTTYARFRLTTDTSIATGVASTSVSTGAAQDGEVEDYQVAIATATFDFGDAPTSLTTIDAALTSTYPSASHILDGVTFLGDRVDADSANQPNVNADGDDTNGSPNDEDGVTFPLAGTNRVLSSGQSNTLSIKASRAGILNAWIDWNQDGDWADANEQIATNVNLTAGSNNLTVTTSNTAPHGATYARFRFSTTSSLGSTGATTANGEVEDYKVNLVLPAPVACNSGVLNNGFEQPVIPSSGDGTPPILQDFGSGRIVSYREADVPWWGTIANSPSSGSGFDQRNAIELWNSTQTTVPAARPFEGNQFAEINAYVGGSLYQELAVPPGSIIRWQVAHRGRVGNDTMGVFMGSPDSEVSQGSYTTPNTEWRVYSGIYTVPNGQFITRFALRAVNTSGGADTSVGNFVDDVRLSNFCAPTVRGYKSAKLTTDADNNSKISPGDTLTYTLYYANSTGAATGPAAGFQINDPLPSGLTITATGAQTITVSGGNTSANKNPNYTGAAAGTVSDLLNPGALMDVGGVIRVDIPVTVGATANGTLLNQGTSSANEFSGQNVRTDNTDNTNTGLPAGVTIPASSVAQTQTPTVDPTQVIVINPAVSSNPNLILVKRITAINGGTATLEGDNLAIYNQDDAYPYDDNLIEPTLAPSAAFPSADTDKWPSTIAKTSSNFLIGGRIGGKTKPNDEVEYTIYFLSTGTAPAKNVTICDRLPAHQAFVPNAFNNITPAPSTATPTPSGDRGIAVFQGSTTNSDTVYGYTNIGDGDAARYYPPGSPLPSACTQPALAEDNGTIVVNLGDVPNATTSGTPKESYGFLRFRARVK